LLTPRLPGPGTAEKGSFGVRGTHIHGTVEARRYYGTAEARATMGNAKGARPPPGLARTACSQGLQALASWRFCMRSAALCCRFRARPSCSFACRRRCEREGCQVPGCL
jgi:hypothetical protein